MCMGLGEGRGKEQSVRELRRQNEWWQVTLQDLVYAAALPVLGTALHDILPATHTRYQL